MTTYCMGKRSDRVEINVWNDSNGQPVLNIEAPNLPNGKMFSGPVFRTIRRLLTELDRTGIDMVYQIADGYTIAVRQYYGIKTELMVEKDTTEESDKSRVTIVLPKASTMLAIMNGLE